MRVSEIRVKQIRVNQGLGVFQFLFLFLNKKPLSEVAPGLLVIHIQIQVV